MAAGGADDAWGGAGQLGGEANRRRPNGGENQWRRRRPCFQLREEEEGDPRGGFAIIEKLWGLSIN